MARSRPFGVFILALCLVACVCAHGKVSKDDAEKTLAETKTAVKKTLNDAKEKSRDAESYLRDADANKRSAERAEAAAAEAAKGNQVAEAIVKKVKDASDQVLKLYTEVYASAKASVDKMKSLVTKAEGLDAKATAIQIVPENTDDYTKAQQSAVSVKTEVGELDKEITAQQGLRPPYDKLNKMSEFVKTAQLAKYNVDAIVAVAKIDTVLKSADDDIKLTEQKSGEISATVQEIKKLADNSPKNLFQYISTLLLHAEGEIRSASNAVKEAKKAKEDIVEQKKRADAALAKFEFLLGIFSKPNSILGLFFCLIHIGLGLKDTKKALQSATTSAINAGYRKNDAEDAISGKTRKPDATQDNDKVKPQGTTGSPGSGDSAMTVSVPLLMALIACAALR